MDPFQIIVDGYFQQNTDNMIKFINDSVLSIVNPCLLYRLLRSKVQVHRL
jgi:hypothetical protein